jgi:hypothetical protein
MRTVSTWSLHRTLGRYVAPDSAAQGGPFMEGPAESRGLTLLELPKALRQHGYGAVQICHFHLASTSPAYLAELRTALSDADITLEALLVDDGDLTDPARADEVEAWMGRWLDVATALGAARARLQVGRAAPTPELIQACADRLRRLADAHPKVRIVIENDKGTMRDAEAVQALLAATGDAVGFLIDTGNWQGPNAEQDLARVASLAETCHAKCRFSGSEPDADAFRRALRSLKAAEYDGPLALIYDSSDDDEWDKLEVVAALCDEVFGERGAIPVTA